MRRPAILLVVLAVAGCGEKKETVKPAPKPRPTAHAEVNTPNVLARPPEVRGRELIVELLKPARSVLASVNGTTRAELKGGSRLFRGELRGELGSSARIRLLITRDGGAIEATTAVVPVR